MLLLRAAQNPEAVCTSLAAARTATRWAAAGAPAAASAETMAAPPAGHLPAFRAT